MREPSIGPGDGQADADAPHPSVSDDAIVELIQSAPDDVVDRGGTWSYDARTIVALAVEVLEWRRRVRSLAQLTEEAADAEPGDESAS